MGMTTRELVTAYIRGHRSGAKAMSSQRYEIRGMIAEGDRAAVQIAWSGALAIAFGALPVGHVMRAAVCSVIELKDGKAWRQEPYDGYLEQRRDHRRAAPGARRRDGYF
jgi:predicted ester cyclase